MSMVPTPGAQNDPLTSALSLSEACHVGCAPCVSLVASLSLSVGFPVSKRERDRFGNPREALPLEGKSVAGTAIQMFG